MPIKSYAPLTPGRRGASTQDTSMLNHVRPPRALRIMKKRTGGRNNQGKITVRHRGGGAKRFIRVIDFRQDRYDEPATIIGLEYDPNRGARLARVQYKDGELRYILATEGLRVGDAVMSSCRPLEFKIGYRMPLEHIPVGTMIHCLELKPGQGAKIVRSAGLSAQLVALEGLYAHIRLPSGEVRMMDKRVLATIGTMSNADYRNVRLGSAGRMRHLGWRPTVRGKVMNPVDHPHGGGEGRQPIGLKAPKTPWGKKALGVKTRKAKKYSDYLILSRRKKK